MNKAGEPKAWLKSAVALLLIAFCLWAAQWQYHRGIERHARNFQISSRVNLPVIKLIDVSALPEPHEWQRVSVTGSFDFSRQILLRNHYTTEGEYGFELLTAFEAIGAGTFWVDCGWVQAPNTALEKPILPLLPKDVVTLVGRLRLNHSLPQGSFFAVSKAGESQLVREANAQAGHAGITSPFYLDLLQGSSPDLTPKVPAQLPELSDGPHMAYAIQWSFFAGLIGYGRFLIRKEHFRQ